MKNPRSAFVFFTLFVVLSAHSTLAAATTAAPTTINVNGTTTIFGNMWMTWNITQADPSAALDVLMDMIVQGDVSGQIGFLTGTGMEGFAIACYMAPSSSTGKCVDIDGYNWDINRRAANSVATLLSTSRVGSLTTFHMRLASLSTSMIGRKSTPMFFAYSGWSNSQNLPLEHPSKGKVGFALNFVTGEQSAVPGKQIKVSIPAVVGAFFAIWFAVMMLCSWCGVVLTRRGYMITLAATVIVFCIGIGGVVFAAWKNYTAALSIAPAFRAFGDGACFLFGLILFPVSRWLSIGQLIRMSFDRLVKFHKVLGFLLFIFILIHFAGMWSEYGMAKMTKNTGDIPALPGLLSFIFFAILLVPALFRRQFYSLFKYTHVLVLAVIITGILHYRKLIIYLLPGGILYILDWIARWIRTFHARAKLLHISYHPDAGVVQMKLRVAAPYVGHPGQFINLRVLPLGLMPHPLTIALINDNVVTFYVKSNGGSTWTARLAELAQRTTDDTASHVHVDIDGPTGVLSVPLNRCPVIVLIAGGIGITPMMCILQALATQPRASHSALSHVLLVWTVRTRALAELIWRDIAKLQAQFHALHPDARLAIRIHCTRDDAQRRQHVMKLDVPQREGSMVPLHDSGSDDSVVVDVVHADGNDIPMLPVLESAVDPTVAPISRGRPNVKEIVSDAASVNETAVYACGPSPLVWAVRRACVPHGNVRLHTETFLF